MSFFQKKQNEELFSLLDKDSEISENLFPDNSPTPDALTPEEVLMSGSEKTKVNGSANALESLKKRMFDARNSENAQKNAEKTETKPEKSDIPQEIDINAFSSHSNNPIPEEPVSPAENSKPQEKTLLEKCRPFILDENGKNIRR